MAKLYGMYEREIRFYSEIAKDIGLYAPRCYCSAMEIDADRYVLLLEDLAPSGRIGDQVAGCSQEEALLAVGELASFHAAWWDSPKLDRVAWLPLGTDLVRAMPALYPQARPVFMELFSGRLTRELADAMEHLAERVLKLLPELEARPQTITHADYRLDNMFFGREGAPYRLAVIDWQVPNRGPAGYDLAYFVSGSMPPEQRRAHESELIEWYHAALLESGVRDYPLAMLRDDYRRALLVALAIEVVGVATVERTNERAVQLWEVMFDRLTAAIMDSNALELLPGTA
jgi:aminoglycoside/choline kinase family phosphotransferase